MRKILLSIAGIFILLVAVVIGRTLGYGPKTDEGAGDGLPPVPAFDLTLAAEHLGEAVRFRTITKGDKDPLPGAEGPWLDFHDWLARTYPAAHRVMDKEMVAGLTLLYRWEGSDPSLDPLILMGHQDVVPVNPGTEGDWDAPPFSGQIVGGRIVGRGTMDDKNSIIALMEAADALAQDGFRPRRTIYFLFGHNEEVSGSGAKAAFDLLAARGVKAEMVLDEGMVSMDPMPLTGKPLSMIGIAEKGYISVELIATGEGGHSSTPPRESANVRLARALVALEENQFPSHLGEPPLDEFLPALGPDLPFIMRMALANRWLLGGQVEKGFAENPASNALIRTTTAPTMLEGSAKENVLPQRAHAVINFRIHPADSVEDVITHVKKQTAGIEGLEVIADEGIASEPSRLSPTDNRAYQVLAAAARGVAPGAPVAPALVLGATDARHAGNVSGNVYRYMPVRVTLSEVEGIHGTNEQISVENLGRMITAYAQIIQMMDEPL